MTDKKKELITEHERLVRVLESPSHEDDKEEAKKQGKELKALKEGKEYKPVNKSFEAIENMTKALKAVHAAALARRQAREEAAAADGPGDIITPRPTRPAWEHSPPPVHRIDTPNPVPARPCGDHHYKWPVGGNEEAKPYHKR